MTHIKFYSSTQTRKVFLSSSLHFWSKLTCDGCKHNIIYFNAESIIISGNWTVISKYPAFKCKLFTHSNHLRNVYRVFNTFLLILSNHKRKVMKSPLFFSQCRKTGQSNYCITLFFLKINVNDTKNFSSFFVSYICIINSLRITNHCVKRFSTYQDSKKKDTKICVMYTLNNDRANPFKMSV